MHFVMEMPAPVREMMRMLHENGFASYLVGGCVRDALAGLTPHDYDITTDAVPEQIIGLFGEERCTYYGKAFGTVCVRMDGEKAEITTFRTEGSYSDSRHPDEVRFSTDVNEDLSRRDFTCNAIAYDPRTGLLDPYHGAEDLQNGILRAVGVPEERFTEDALRILRGMRFYARFGLKPETATDAAMRSQAKRLKQISVERVFSELCGMLTGKCITDVLMAYPDILGVWIPEILPCVDFDQKSRWHDFTVWEHIARAVGNTVPDLTLRMTMMLHDIGKPHCMTLDERGGHFAGHAQLSAEMADKILLRLRSDTKLRKQVVQLIDMHRTIPRTMPDDRRLLGQLGEEQFWRLIEVFDADRKSKWIGREDSRADIDRMEECLNGYLTKGLCCGIGCLEVDGKDAAALGFSGKKIGKVLDEVHEEVIHDRLPNEREPLLAYLRELASRQ
jgi:tRNA nucleotidyltransferase (CCA-adding enzyme)